jgi:multiple sugar transport system permease protein
MGRKLPYLLLMPSLIFLIVVAAYPTAFAFYLSFFDWDLTDPERGMVFVGVNNFVKMVQDERFINGLARSLYFTGLSVGISFTIALLIALLLNRPLKGNAIFRTIYLVPWVLAPIMVGFSFRLMLNFNIGVINDLLSLLGLPRQAFLGEPSLAMLALILTDVWQWTPFLMLVILAGLEAMPRAPIEAAQIDGASRLQIFRHVTLPLLRPVLLIAILIRTMDAFREYDKIAIMTAGGPGRATETLAVYVAKVGFSHFDMGYASAMGLFMLYFTVFVSWLYVKVAGVGK